MFIFERLFGVFTYCYFLLIVFLLIRFTTISYKGILKGYTVLLSIMGFLYEPYVTADLYRIYEQLELFASYNFADFFNIFGITSTIPLARCFYWLIGKTGIYQLVPFLACFVSYSCIFYILIRSAEKFRIGRKSIALVVLFFMSIGNYIIVISNIRTMFSLSLLCFCFFRETVERKKSFLHIFLYVTAALFHNLAVIIFGLRIAVIFFDRHISVFKRAGFLICAGIGFACAAVVFRSALLDIFDKVLLYLNGGQYSYAWEYLIGFIAMTVEIYAIYVSRKHKEGDTHLLTSSRQLLLLCLTFAITLCYEFSIFHRLVTYICPILTLPQMLIAIDKPTGEGRRDHIALSNYVFITSLGMLFLACFRGSMCSFKFFAF